MNRFRWLAFAVLAIVLTACDNGTITLTVPTVSISSVQPTTIEPGAEVTVSGAGFYETGSSGPATIDVCGITTEARLVNPVSQLVALPPGGQVAIRIGTELAFAVPEDGVTAGEGQVLELTMPDGSSTSFTGITCTAGEDWDAGPEPEPEPQPDPQPDPDPEPDPEPEPVEVTAVLNANVTSGVAPLVIAFNANGSMGEGELTYAWDFGIEGETAEGSEVEYEYSHPGSFTVTLTVQDETGAAAATGVEITVHPELTANIRFTDGVLRAPATVSFDAGGSTGIEPLAYSWSFGVADASSHDAQPEFTYGDPGTYEVSLTVTDAEGGEATSSVSLSVHPAVLAVIDFEEVLDVDGALDSIILSGHRSTGVLPLSYTWTIDGVLVSWNGPHGEYTFCEAGSYEVGLTVKDAYGEVSTASETLVVPPSAAACSRLSSIGSAWRE